MLYLHNVTLKQQTYPPEMSVSKVSIRIISISKNVSALLGVYHFAVALSYSFMQFRAKFISFYHRHELVFPKHKSHKV